MPSVMLVCSTLYGCLDRELLAEMIEQIGQLSVAWVHLVYNLMNGTRLRTKQRYGQCPSRTAGDNILIICSGYQGAQVYQL